ncbi:MAG: ElyC/SanA/YdcF family protein [Candidatus Gracilibacteria bacterium]|nr:ElyC/SanA/YdcF family protein [Candidatus Gracilibacteria bacterium]
MKKYFIYSSLFLSILLLFIVGVNYYVLTYSKEDYYYNVEGLDNKYVGLVFGASILANKEPSDILKDRLKVAYNAYKLGKIKKIIVSGDNSLVNHNEPEVMKQYLIKEGVKEFDIYQDYAGFDTYDSLYRAHEIFGVDELVLFTQDFHLKRAMYISKKMGIKTYGVETNLQKYLKESYNNRREIFARIKAFFEIEVFKSKPKFLGDKVPIISDEELQEIKNGLLENKSE